jgi:hypothetical protein
MVSRLVIDFGELVKVALKGGCRRRDGCIREEIWGYWVLWPLCVFGCISVVVEVLVSGIAGGGDVYSSYSRLVSGW